MNKSIQIIQKSVIILTLALSCIVIPGPLSSLKEAKVALVGGRNEIVKGRSDLAAGYYKIQTEVIDALSAPVHELTQQIDDMSDQKSIVKKVHNVYIPGALAALSALSLTAVGLPFAAPLIAVLSVVEEDIKDLPSIFDALIDTLGSIKGTITTVKNTIEPVAEKMNPNNPEGKLVYQKFDNAQVKFDAAINKIDAIIEHLEKKTTQILKGIE